MSYDGKIHRLKTLPQHFNAVVAGHKTFELRKNDRDFQVGDVLVLQEWDGKSYTGSASSHIIKHKLTGPLYGLEAGFCILSI